MASSGKDLVIHMATLKTDASDDEIDSNKRSGDDAKNENINELNFPFFLRPEEMRFNYWKYLFNPKDKSILGRTKKRLGICLLFYFVFYAVLAAFWTTLLTIALYYYSCYEGPWITAEDMNILGPGIAHYPPLFKIDLTHDRKGSIESLDKLLSSYLEVKAVDYNDCQTTPSPPENCYFDVTALGDCAPGRSYGYDSETPCIFLKLNRAYGWKPVLYNRIEDLPKETPANLKDYIEKLTHDKMDLIWLSCEGHRQTDRDSLKKISFWPNNGFPSYFYPFRGSIKHLSPLIAIQLESRKRGATIKIRCQAWAKNLSTHQAYGSNIIFEVVFS